MAASPRYKALRWAAALLLLLPISPSYANGLTCTDIGSFSLAGNKTFLTSPVVTAGQSFADGYCFTLDDPAVVLDVGVQNDVVSNPPLVDYNISGLNLELFEQTNGNWTSMGSGLSMVDAFDSGPTLLLANVTGTASGATGGIYSLGFSVSAVPLPGAFFLFATGLIGLAGTSARFARRS